MQAVVGDVVGTGTEEVEVQGKNFKARDDVTMGFEVGTVRSGGRTCKGFRFLSP